MDTPHYFIIVVDAFAARIKLKSCLHLTLKHTERRKLCSKINMDL